MNCRNIFYLSLCVVFVLVQSCTSGTSDVKVGFLLPTYDIARYTKDRDYFSEHMKELGGEVLVDVANNNENLQLDQAKNMIEQGIDVLVVIAVNPNTAAAIARLAHDNGIKVIAYERLIQNAEIDYFIGFDHKKAGNLMAEYALSHKPTGNYVLLGGDKSDQNAVFIKESQQQGIASAVSGGQVKVLYDVYIEDWTEETAYHEMRKVLDLSGVLPDAVLASNDNIAAGAIEALAKNGISGTVLITGLDADLNACKRIAAGTQSMTVYKPLKQQAYKAAEIAFAIAKGKIPEDKTLPLFNGRAQVPAILLDPMAVDASNLKSTIIADGFYTEAEVFSSESVPMISDSVTAN